MSSYSSGHAPRNLFAYWRERSRSSSVTRPFHISNQPFQCHHSMAIQIWEEFFEHFLDIGSIVEIFPSELRPRLCFEVSECFPVFFAAAEAIPLQICLKYHPCLRLTLQSRRQIESNKSPLPCSLRALALNTENPRFVRTGGLCSSSRPEDSGRSWVLWSFGFAGHATSGGRAMPSSSQVVSAK